MKKFEYCVKDLYRFELNDGLNKLGSEGWELINTCFDGSVFICFLKKETFSQPFDFGELFTSVFPQPGKPC